MRNNLQACAINVRQRLQHLASVVVAAVIDHGNLVILHAAGEDANVLRINPGREGASLCAGKHTVNDGNMGFLF